MNDETLERLRKAGGGTIVLFGEPAGWHISKLAVEDKGSASGILETSWEPVTGVTVAPSQAVTMAEGHWPTVEPGLATGGPVESGRPYLVGGDGPSDLFVPKPGQNLVGPGVVSTEAKEPICSECKQWLSVTQRKGFDMAVCANSECEYFSSAFGYADSYNWDNHPHYKNPE